MTNIVKRFGEQTVLHDVSFNVEKQEVFGLLGPSGAGKTTIINILAKQIAAESGEARIDAKPLETGLMLEEDGLYSRLTCTENLNLFAGIYGLSKSKVPEVLASVGLEEAGKKPVNKLSQGMRKRLALARAIIHTPKVLFLDEPTANLDPTTAAGIHKLIKDLCAGGTTVFLTTHNMEEAVDLCDHVALLNKGKIVEYGSPQDICTKYDSFKTVPDLGAVFIKLTSKGVNV
ncbi:MAG: ABC transporter ATP-binding protein [Defluviitaleaceae bacterium]|nr:ABC transporter ATP-binding protein [Defluviitaleaceae bacterium]